MKIALLLAVALLAHRAHASYHILVADGENSISESEESFREQSRRRSKRSLTDTASIIESFIPHENYDEGSGSPNDDVLMRKEHTLQFLVKNTDPENALRTTLQEVIPGNASLTEFLIHNEGMSYKYDTRNGKKQELVASEYDKAVNDGYSAVMIGDVEALNSRCTDCRSEHQEGDEDISANLNVAPGDALSVSLSYFYPVVDGKSSYRSDVSIQVHQPAEHFCGVLMSPDYPDSYPSNSDLTWLLQVPAGMVVNATVLSFESESCCDHLYVYNGPSDSHPTLAVISGNNYSGHSVLSTEPDVLIKFQSDDSLNEGGFALEFCAMIPAIDEVKEEDEDKIPLDETYNIFGTRGTISSPGYPFSYPPSSVITWIISGPTTKRFVLDAFDFDVLDGETLKIYDDISGVLLWNMTRSDYCSYNTIETSGYRVRLVFTTVEKLFYSPRGFLIRYYAEQSIYTCLFNIVATVGGEWETISSPNYPNNYNNSEDCLWIVSTPNDAPAFLEIQVSDLNLEPVFDLLRIYQGNVTDPENLLATLSGVGGKQLEYATLKNQAAVQFSSDGSVSFSGFQLKIRALGASYQWPSSTQTLTWDEGVVANPGFPSVLDYYGHNCYWLISVSEGYVIDVYIVEVSLRHSSCFIRFYDGDSASSPRLLSDYYIAFEEAVSFRSSSNKVFVQIYRYSSSSSHDITYFFRYNSSLPYLKSGPRQPLTNAPGIIKSPNYPRYFYPNTDAEWLIQAPADQYVNLYMDRIRLHSSDVVIFYNGDKPVNIIRQCSSTSCSGGTWLASSLNSMLVTMTTRSNRYGYFKFKFDFSQNACNLVYKFDSYSGYAISPTIPANAPQRYCTYSINVPSGSISYSFEYFSSEEGSDHLSIYDGDSRFAPEIAYLSGVQSSTFGKTTGNHLTMYFATDSDGTGSYDGFKMNYCESSHCPNDGLPAYSNSTSYAYVTMRSDDPFKYLFSPGFENQYPSNSDFFWYIECNNNYDTYFVLYHVDLDFSDFLKFYNHFGINSLVHTVYGSDNFYDDVGPITTVQNSTVWFHTGPYFTGQGFVMKYYC